MNAYTEALQRAIQQYCEAVEFGQSVPKVRWYRIFKRVLELKP